MQQFALIQNNNNNQNNNTQAQQNQPNDNNNTSMQQHIHHAQQINQQTQQYNQGQINQLNQMQQHFQQFQINQQPTQQLNQNQNNQQINEEGGKSKVLLNPEVAEYNPTSLFGQPTLTVQEQLFNQLQAINTQMQNIKQQTENELTPTLMQLNQQMLIYQTNPALLQLPPHHMQYMQIQQNQIIISSQINQMQMTYKQLEANLKYTQDMYQKNKNEQYIIPTQPYQPITDAYTQQHTHTNTLNLTQGVTDVSVTYGGWQPHNTNNEAANNIINNQNQQPQEQTDNFNNNNENPEDNIENKQQNDSDNSNSQQQLQQNNPFSKFKGTGSWKPPSRQRSFGDSIISTPTHEPQPPQSPESQPENDDNDNDNDANNTSKPKPIMEKVLSYSSQQSDDSSKSDNEDINPGETRYGVNQLLEFQKNYLNMNWGSFTSIYKYELPREVRFITHGIDNEKYMENVAAMFARKSDNPWQWGEDYKNEKEKLIKKLTGVLNKMTPEKFTTVAKQTMDIVNEYANTKEEMNIIIGLILSFGIKQPVFGDQYAKLCSHLQDFLPKLRMVNNSDWVVNDTDLGQTFRKMVIAQTNDLFLQHHKHTPTNDEIKQWKDDVFEKEKRAMYKEELDLKKDKRKRNFFAVMVLVAELYNVDLIKKNLVFKGVFEAVLKGPSEVDVEGMCRLFKRCGRKLENEAKKYVDKYLSKLGSHAGKFDFRTRVLVDEIKEMRKHNWEYRLKKERAKTKDEIKEEFEKERSGRNRGRGDRNRGRRDDDYYGDKLKAKKMDRRGRNYSSENLRPVGTDRKSKHRYSSDKSGMSSSKNYGSYQKKQTNKSGMSKSKSYGDYIDNDSVSYGDKDTVHMVKGYIDEYMASGVIDEILQLDVSDFKVWASVISDGLRDRKSSEIGFFIDLVLMLFEEGVLHNKQANFVNIVIKYLVIELDDNCMDCPNFVKYVGELFANLCYNECVNPNPCFDYFIKKYEEYSEYMFVVKKKVINKVIKYSVAELKRLQASDSLINNVQRKVIKDTM